MEPPLAFPPYELTVQDRDGKAYVLDPVRQKWVRLTPEERVRQLLLLLLADLGFPPALTAVEKGFDGFGSVWRADVVVHDRSGRPLLLAECKAPDVPVGQATFDQLARYNVSIQARALLATNGHAHYCARFGSDGRLAFFDTLPTYDALLRGD